VVKVEEVKMATPILTTTEYAKLSGMTVTQVKNLCSQGILPAVKTNGGQWRIKMYKDSVPREVHEKALEEIAYLKAKLKSMKAILENV